ncbi:2-oxoglutarate dehydrogenase E1 [Bacillus sp. EB01]|uniref:2-oxoglutarate dehydrogenase E1 n=1 Tax=Bacillus sp. EB01 TaxID=1347086 RepID=UPI000B06BA24
MMKIISMIQPWASLFVLGESQFETRTWRTNYRGKLAIHSSKRPDKKACNAGPVQKLLKFHGLSAETLPTGMIIGVCELKNCIRVIENTGTMAVLEDGRIISGKELWLGDYRVGCFAWEVEGMRALDEFIPAKGQLGLWEYDGNVL